MRSDRDLARPPLVTGAGSDGDGGGEKKSRFSLKLSRDDPVSVDELDESEDIEILVLRRSRILTRVCIQIWFLCGASAGRLSATLSMIIPGSFYP